MMIRRTLLLVGVLAWLAADATAADWARFRGPNGSGIATDSKAMPTEWDGIHNVKWKVDLPGPGSSSPILVGDRVFVTCWTGYGMSEQDPGEQEALRRHLICLNRHTGETIWTSSVDPVLPEDEYGGMFAQHGYASHTPVSDGTHIFVYFGKAGALAYDMNGKELWRTKIGAELDPHKWGSASSPILHKDYVIITATSECEGIVALDKKTGKEVWRQEAAGLNGVWGTPVLVDVDDKRTDLVLSTAKEIWGFNPDTGKLRWYSNGLGMSSMSSSAVAADGVVFVMESGPSGGGGMAVRAGGSKDVSDSHIMWSGRQANRIGTPLVYEGRVYSFSGTTVTCCSAETGETVFKGRMRSPDRGSRSGRSNSSDRRAQFASMAYASPIIADGKIYVTARNGAVTVMTAGTEYEPLGMNRVTEGKEDFSATPAAGDGQLFLRSDKSLYCIADVPGSAELAAKAAAEKEKTAKVSQAKEEASSDERVAEGRPGSGGRGEGRGSSGRGGRGSYGGGGSGGPGGGGSFDPAAMFKNMDQNGDGKLAGAELVGGLADNLDAVDTDKDKAISLDEFREGMRQMMSRGGSGGRSGGGGSRDRRAGRPDRPARPAMESEEI